MSLDRLYRPIVFADALGQDGTVKVLSKTLEDIESRVEPTIFHGPYGSGKCVVGSTLTITSQGLLPIESLMGGEGQIESSCWEVFQEGGSTSTSEYSYRGGVRDTVRVVTHFGYEIEGTANHRIRALTPDGTINWVCLGDITETHYPCIVRGGLFGPGVDLTRYTYPRKARDFSSKEFVPGETITVELARLLGYLVGDGSYNPTTGFSITSSYSEVLEDISRVVDSVFGAHRIVPDKRTANQADVRLNRVQARHFLKYLGLEEVTAIDKVVPWSILQSGEEIVREFLVGFFEADGSVESRCISARSKSERLIQQIQVLLLLFGIISRRKPREIGKEVYWYLWVQGASRELFREHIGFVSDRKNRRLEHLFDGGRDQGKKRKLSNLWELIPYQSRWVKALWDSLPVEVRKDHDKLLQSRSGRSNLTRRVAKRIVKLFPMSEVTSHFSDLLNTRYFYDKVGSITHHRTSVFDLNVPEGEMFAANGFMNHNTTLARIYARAILCGSRQEDGSPCNVCDACKAFFDETHAGYHEINGANITKVEEFRKILNDTAYQAQGSKYRVYLIDECHMMSKASQNLFLKPLEEGILGVFFFFCTTEFHKIIPTIQSRCLDYGIRPIPSEKIAQRVIHVCSTEGIAYEEEAVHAMVEVKGHFRDILKFVGQVKDIGGVVADNVYEYLDIGVNDIYLKVLAALKDDVATAMSELRNVLARVSALDAYNGLAQASMDVYKVKKGVRPSQVVREASLRDKVYEAYGESITQVTTWLLDKGAYRIDQNYLISTLLLLHKRLNLPVGVAEGATVVVKEVIREVPAQNVKTDPPAVPVNGTSKTPPRSKTTPLTDLDDKARKPRSQNTPKTITPSHQTDGSESHILSETEFSLLIQKGYRHGG